MLLWVSHPPNQACRHHWEQCTGNLISYQFSYFPRYTAPHGFTPPAVAKILHCCEMFLVPNSWWTQYSVFIFFLPFEDCWWMFSLDSKWLRWSTRCLGNFQNEWSQPQENHIKLKTVREGDWLIIWVDLVRTNFLWKETWEQNPH